MEIEIKTASYAHNKNFNAIVDELISQGFKYTLNFGGKYTTEGVTITTDAPASTLDGVKFTKSAVTLRP